jgi:hypothetical protein
MRITRLLTVPLTAVTAATMLAGCAAAPDVRLEGDGSGFCTALEAPTAFGIPLVNTGTTLRTVNAIEVLDTNGLAIDDIWIVPGRDDPSLLLVDVAKADEAELVRWNERSAPEGFELQPGTDYLVLVVANPGVEAQVPSWAEGVRVRFEGWPASEVEGSVAFGFTRGESPCGPPTLVE